MGEMAPLVVQGLTSEPGTKSEEREKKGSQDRNSVCHSLVNGHVRIYSNYANQLNNSTLFLL